MALTPCKACQKRKKALQAIRDKQAARGQRIQAALTGAVIAASEAVGEAIGIRGEETDGRVRTEGSADADS